MILENSNKNLKAILIIIVILLTMVLSSCGAKSNTVGTDLADVNQGLVVTKQDGNIFYIKNGDVYKTTDLAKKGKLVLDGDYSFINVVGEKLYYYDNGISSISKSNMQGFKIEVIAELYIESMIVNRDNIIVSINKGNSEKTPYDIGVLKRTEKKLANVTPKIIKKNAKLIGVGGDEIYYQQIGKKGIEVYSCDIKGENESKLAIIKSNDAKVYIDGDDIYALYKVKDELAIYKCDKKTNTKVVTIGEHIDFATNSVVNSIYINNGILYYESVINKAEKYVSVLYKLDTNKKGATSAEIMNLGDIRKLEMTIKDEKFYTRVTSWDDKAAGTYTVGDWKEYKEAKK
ncbi:MAG: DUF5050 domain-containing protein [Eubacteriales bacterium]|nr:DUF5050 domain-containing protein [Eubacteriales bacterium]MDY3332173.1 DUF5050 domain-containing protein [Gallibacter sp.]